MPEDQTQEFGNMFDALFVHFDILLERRWRLTGSESFAGSQAKDAERKHPEENSAFFVETANIRRSK
jgi:hypothetical protein